MEDTKQPIEEKTSNMQAELKTEDSLKDQDAKGVEQTSSEETQKTNTETNITEASSSVELGKDVEVSEKKEPNTIGEDSASATPPMEKSPESTTSHPVQGGVYPPVGEGVRKLKKIKRPVGRIPQGNPLPPMPQMINLDENLDQLLDNQLNLPVLNTATPKTSTGQEYTGMKVSSVAQQSQEERRPQPRFISDKDLTTPPRFIDQLMEDNLFTYKGAAVIAAVVFILTLLIGKMLFGGETVVKDGLQGVVVNAEVPRGRARCGVAERTQGCVLYIMNPQRQDLQGRDFYDLASQLTGRQRFVVETGNMRYSNIKIRAGEIAQINIPPLQ